MSLVRSLMNTPMAPEAREITRRPVGENSLPSAFGVPFWFSNLVHYRRDFSISKVFFGFKARTDVETGPCTTTE